MVFKSMPSWTISQSGLKREEHFNSSVGTFVNKQVSARALKVAVSHLYYSAIKTWAPLTNILLLWVQCQFQRRWGLGLNTLGGQWCVWCTCKLAALALGIMDGVGFKTPSGLNFVTSLVGSSNMNFCCANGELQTYQGLIYNNMQCDVAHFTMSLSRNRPLVAFSGKNVNTNSLLTQKHKFSSSLWPFLGQRIIHKLTQHTRTPSTTICSAFNHVPSRNKACCGISQANALIINSLTQHMSCHSIASPGS